MLEFLIITFLFIICLVVLIYPIIKPKKKQPKNIIFSRKKKIIFRDKKLS